MLQQLIKNNSLRLFEHFLAISSVGISKVATLLILIINSQMMPADEFGKFTILLIIANMIMVIVNCGSDMWLNPFTQHNNNKRKKAPDITRDYLKLSLINSCAILSLTPLLFLLQPLIPCSPLTLLLVIICGICLGLTESILAIIRTTNRIGHFFLIRDFIIPITLVAAIFLLKINSNIVYFSIAALLYANAVALLLIGTTLNKKIYFPKTSNNKKNLGTLYKYSAKLISNNLASRLSQSLDTLMLSFVIPISTVGQYRLLSQIANGFTVVQHFTLLALPWQMSANTKEKDSSELSIRYKMLIASALPALILILIIAKPILGLLGTEYSNIFYIFCVLLIIRFNELLWGPQHETLISNKKITSDLKSNIAALITWLPIFFTATNITTTINAAVIATGLASLTLQGTRRYYLKKHKLKPQYSINILIPITSTILALTIIITFFSTQ